MSKADRRRTATRRGVRVAHVSSCGDFASMAASNPPPARWHARCQIFDGAISRTQEIPYGRQSIRFRIEGTVRSTQRLRQSVRQERLIGPTARPERQERPARQPGKRLLAKRRQQEQMTHFPTRRACCKPMPCGGFPISRHRNNWQVDGSRRSQSSLSELQSNFGGCIRTSGTPALIGASALHCIY